MVAQPKTAVAGRTLAPHVATAVGHAVQPRSAAPPARPAVPHVRAAVAQPRTAVLPPSSAPLRHDIALRDHARQHREEMERAARKHVRDSLVNTGQLPKEEQMRRAADPSYRRREDAHDQAIYERSMEELERRAARERDQVNEARSRHLIFVNSQPWRQWTETSGVTGAGTVTERRGMPPSSRDLPERLVHVTHYTAVDSIRNTGLDPDRVNSGTGLNAAAADKKYFIRDAALRATYLATSSREATSMDERGEQGGRVTLIIHTSRQFRQAHMRTSLAAGAGGPIDEQSPSDTVLSFRRIPPHWISIVDPDTHRERPLTDFPIHYDWRRVATPPRDGSTLLSRAEMAERRERVLSRNTEENRRLAEQRFQAEEERERQRRAQREAAEQRAMSGFLASFNIPKPPDSDSDSDKEGEDPWE
jgi:hypothetical protein